ncbi:MAG: SprT-like domain-containing protein [Victivallales bacterium]|nr:SprT-like domain-containing protein [Victivallales bacterium]
MSNNAYQGILSAALAQEWRRAVERLRPELSAQLRQPVFALNPDLGCWGQWRGGTMQCIELRATLVSHHPWYVVVDVLRHETAHQICEICFPGEHEVPHGPRFQQVCQWIGARPQASGEYPTLDQVVFAEDAAAEGADTAAARLVVKVRKLLSLSQSANQAEAEAALLKARELQAKYAEELADAEAHEQAVAETMYTIGVGPVLKRLSVDGCLIGNILQEFFHVIVVWDYQPDLERPGQNLKQLMLSGTRKDLKIASYVYDCLTSYMEHAVYELPTNVLGRVLTSKRSLLSFKIGVLTGFQNAMREQNQRPEMRALVQSDRSRLEEYRKWVYPHLRNTGSRLSATDPTARAAGEAAGRKFTLRHGLDKSGKMPKQLRNS